jgi:hypothetical protein
MIVIDLRPPVGRPLSPSQLGVAVGLSSQTIRAEIKAGEVRAVRVGPARRYYRIPWEECRRYAVQIGILRVTRSTTT